MVNMLTNTVALDFDVVIKHVLNVIASRITVYQKVAVLPLLIAEIYLIERVHINAAS